MESRMQLLRTFYPEADLKDWRLIDAGIRVQAIKRTDGKAGIVHYGTEIVTNKEKAVPALLGASPGASVSVALMLKVIQDCLSELFEHPDSAKTLCRMFPTYELNLLSASSIHEFRDDHARCDELLQLKLYD
jgi:malate dehydrogenase (quinone)